MASNRFTRALEFQAPNPTDQPIPHQNPANLTIQDVCPHCLTRISGYAFVTREGHTIQSYWCQTHGDVIPRLSAVHNPTHHP